MKLMKKIAALVLAFAVAAGTGYGVWFYMNLTHASEPVVKIVEVPVEKIVETKTEVSGETIEEGLKDMGELVTAEYFYTHVESCSSVRSIGDWEIGMTRQEFVYSYDGKVTAGIDFDQLRVEKEEDAKVIRVTVPEAKIVGSEVDQNSFQVYCENNNIMNPVTVDSVLVSFADMKNEEEQKALDRGLLTEAEENATQLIRNFIRSICTENEYEVLIEPSADTAAS